MYICITNSILYLGINIHVVKWRGVFWIIPIRFLLVSEILCTWIGVKECGGVGLLLMEIVKIHPGQLTRNAHIQTADQRSSHYGGKHKLPKYQFTDKQNRGHWATPQWRIITFLPKQVRNYHHSLFLSAGLRLRGAYVITIHCSVFICCTIINASDTLQEMNQNVCWMWWKRYGNREFVSYDKGIFRVYWFCRPSLVYRWSTHYGPHEYMNKESFLVVTDEHRLQGKYYIYTDGIWRCILIGTQTFYKQIYMLSQQ